MKKTCKEALNQGALKSTIHSYLFVDTKKVTHCNHSRNALKVDPSDLLALIIYYTSYFKPPKRSYSIFEDDSSDYESAEESWAEYYLIFF